VFFAFCCPQILHPASLQCAGSIVPSILFMQTEPFGHLNLMRRFLVMTHRAIDD
jgi:hypothetical protein